MKNDLMSAADAAALIETGAALVIAGAEAALTALPRGNWIGGTTVYFVAKDGGCVDRERVFVTALDGVRDTRTAVYHGEALTRLAEGRFRGGFDVILIPAFSAEHEAFALGAATIPGIFDQPLMGWIAGVHLDEIGKVTPKVVDGATGQVHASGAAVLHLALEPGLVPQIDILNLFEPDLTAPAITFDTTGFAASTARVDGKALEVARFVAETGLDTRLPLVADYAGAMINVSFQSVDGAGAKFYAPVMKDVVYRPARSPGDYAKAFAGRAGGDGGSEMSCNCILNYLYGDLEGRQTGSFTGPVTFGEIAYVLVNQTMVRLRLAEAAQMAAE